MSLITKNPHLVKPVLAATHMVDWEYAINRQGAPSVRRLTAVPP